MTVSLLQHGSKGESKIIQAQIVANYGKLKCFHIFLGLQNYTYIETPFIHGKPFDSPLTTAP